MVSLIKYEIVESLVVLLFFVIRNSNKEAAHCKQYPGLDRVRSRCWLKILEIVDGWVIHAQINYKRSFFGIFSAFGGIFCWESGIPPTPIASGGYSRMYTKNADGGRLVISDAVLVSF